MTKWHNRPGSAKKNACMYTLPSIHKRLSYYQCNTCLAYSSPFFVIPCSSTRSESDTIMHTVADVVVPFAASGAWGYCSSEPPLAFPGQKFLKLLNGYGGLGTACMRYLSA